MSVNSLDIQLATALGIYKMLKICILENSKTKSTVGHSIKVFTNQFHDKMTKKIKMLYSKTEPFKINLTGFIWPQNQLINKECQVLPPPLQNSFYRSIALCMEIYLNIAKLLEHKYLSVIEALF